MSTWHLLWQCFARKECREVRVSERRADIRTPAGTTIEIQRSPITVETVISRNEQHGTTAMAKFYASELAAFLAKVPQRAM